MTPFAGAPRRAVAGLDAFLFEPAPPTAEQVAPAERPEPGDGGRDAAGRSSAPVVLVTAIGNSGGGPSLAAAVAVALAGRVGSRGVLMVDVDPPPRGRGPTVLASNSARELEDHVRSLGARFGAAAARGHLCYLPLTRDDDPLDPVADLLGRGLPVRAVVVHLPETVWPRAVADPRLRAGAGLMRADLPSDRSLAALAVRELHDLGLRAKVISRPLGRVASRRALAGIEPGGAASGRAARLVRGLVPD